MDIQTILLCLLIESILYFWFLFLAIDMFEVNDIDGCHQENRFYDVSRVLCILGFVIFLWLLKEF